MSRDVLQEKAQRGQQAKRLLEDPALTEAFDSLKEEAMAAWKATRSEDIERREDCWRTYKTLEMVRGKLAAYWHRGEDAQKELDGALPKKPEPI